VDDITDEVARSLFTTPDGALNDREMVALEAWLDGNSDVAWKDSSSAELPIPTSDSALNSRPCLSPKGFDDNFSGFVSSVPHPSLQVSDTPPDVFIFGTPQTVATADLPSPEDVAAASSKIFQSAALTNSASHTSSSHQRDIEDDRSEPFDLTQILGVLRLMKEEISLIEDADNRRNAAATAALGLIAGLGLDSGVDEGSEIGEPLSVEE
jgi:hypothetical protein